MSTLLLHTLQLDQFSLIFPSLIAEDNANGIDVGGISMKFNCAYCLSSLIPSFFAVLEIIL